MPGRGERQWLSALRLGVAAACVCLNLAVAAVPGVYNVRFRTYSTVDGLSQATALAMTQDTAGFLWIGTQDGLNRFDGYTFKNYRHERNDAGSLADNYIPALANAADGGLWVGTQAGGLDRYDTALDRFIHYPADPARADALASNQVTALLCDRRGRLWVATTSGRLQWLDAGQQAFRDTPLGRRAPLRMVRSMLELGDGSILLGTREGLWRADPQANDMRELRFDAAQSLDVQGLALGATGDLWVSTVRTGLFHFAADEKPLAHFHEGAEAAYALPSDEIRGLHFDASGRLWIATKLRGLLCLNPADGSIVDYLHDPLQGDSVGANRQETVFVDRDGLIWAGSWVNGISVHDPRTEAFATITAIAGDTRTLPARPVGSVLGDADGSLWLGVLEGGGLVHFDLHKGVIARYVNDPAKPDSFSPNLVEYSLRAQDGSLWVATAGGGLHRMAPGAHGFQHFRHDDADPDSLGSDDLLTLAQDRAGTLWIGTTDAGLDELCAGCTRFRHHPHDPLRPQSAGADTVSTILETRSGDLWVGFRPGGLDRYDRAQDRFEHFRARADDATSLSNDTVTTLMEDAHGQLWIGTQGGGLNHMLVEPAGVRFEAITRADGLDADAIGSIFEDGAGLLWVSTTAGISRYDPRSRHVLNIDRYQGAQGLGYFVDAGAKLADGRIVFGGRSGVTVFDPAKVALPASPRPVITDVLLQNAPADMRWRDEKSPVVTSPWSGDGEVRLDHHQNSVSFEFGVLAFAGPENVAYSYRLKGYDEGWIETGATRRYAAYTSLPAGEYLLQVRARSDGGDWNPNEARVRVRVLSAPWASWPAYAAYAAAIILAAGVVGWRTRVNTRRKLRAQARLRASEERLKSALWGSGGELWDVDLRTGGILRENRLEHLRATHETGSQSLSSYRPFVHPDDLHAFERELRAHLKGETEFLEANYRSQGIDGDWRWLLTRGRVAERDATGRALRVAGTTQDITTLKRAEESLRKLNEELESRVETRTADLRRANAELRRTLEQLTLAQRQLFESEKMAALGGLVAGIAHEINTPLGVTVTAASHLGEESRRIARLRAENRLTDEALADFQATASDSAEIILRNLQRADRLIKSFKLIAVDQSTEERREIELGAYLGEILTSMDPVLKKSPHKVRVQCAEPLRIDTYPGALYQIFSNLLMNSLTHAFDAGTAGRISIEVRRAGALVMLQYRDNGKGMSDAIRAQIFEPFFTTRRGQGGSGLGMHVVYNLVTQLLRGSIRVESTPGAGTLFEIFLPLAPPLAD